MQYPLVLRLPGRVNFFSPGISLNIWPEVVPQGGLLKCMTQSDQQRLGKGFSPELDAEGQSITVLATRQGYGGSAAEVVGYRESAPIGVVQ